MRPACWRRGLEISELKVEVSDEEIVEVRYAGDDFVAVVRHPGAANITLRLSSECSTPP